MFKNGKIWAFGLDIVDTDEIEIWSFVYSSCICVNVSVSTSLPPEDMFISYLCICFKNFGLTPSFHIPKVAAALALRAQDSGYPCFLYCWFWVIACFSCKHRTLFHFSKVLFKELICNIVLVSDVQQSDSVIYCSVTQLCLTLCYPMACMVSLSISQNLLTLMSIESMMPSNHLILCHPLLLLPSIFPSNFSNESALCIR